MSFIQDAVEAAKKAGGELLTDAKDAVQKVVNTPSEAKEITNDFVSDAKKTISDAISGDKKEEEAK